jgi:hypothetical protein
MTWVEDQILSCIPFSTMMIMAKAKKFEILKEKPGLDDVEFTGNSVF